MSSVDGVRRQNTRVMEKIETGELSDGGMLSPEEFDEFFEGVQGESTVLEQVQAVPVDADSGELPRLKVDDQLARAVAEGESVAENTIDQPSVPYETVKLSLPWKITWEAANETIDDLDQTVLDSYQKQFAADLESLSSVGDTSSSDDFETIADGWLTLAADAGTAVYNHADADGNPQPVNNELFEEMRSLMPDRYKQRRNPIFLGSLAQREKYQEFLTDRTTDAGDQMLIEGQEPTPYGFSFNAPLDWPDDKFMMTDMSNLGYVIQDDIRLKSTTEAEENVMNDIEAMYNLLAKIDFVLINPEGVIRGENVEEP